MIKGQRKILGWGKTLRHFMQYLPFGSNCFGLTIVEYLPLRPVRTKINEKKIVYDNQKF